MSEQSAIDVYIYSIADLCVRYSNQNKSQVIRCIRDSLLSSYINEDSIPEYGLIYIHNEYGKPQLQDFPEIKFNQSHTKNYLAIAVNRSNLEIGVDIEEKNRQVGANIFAYVLNKLELSILQQADNHHHAFLRMWTIKEAIVKAHGIGILWDMSLIDTIASADSANNQQKYGCSKSELGHWAYRASEDEYLFIAVAYEYQQEQLPVTVKRLK